VLNDVYGEAERQGVVVHGVRVTASGGFDADAATSTGIYVVDIDGPESAEDSEALLDTVDSVAEIPTAIRASAAAERMPG
jgi:hypothetical protein